MRTLSRAIIHIFAVAAVFSMPASPASAQSQELDVPDDARWQHANTGIIMAPDIAGYDRTGITVTAQYELDLQVQYTNRQDTYATVYIFRPAIGTLPVWFDRSKAVLETTDQWQTVTPAEIEKSFVPPAQENTSAFMAVYKSDNPQYSYTGVTLVPVNGWMVKLRMTSVRKNGRELAADMQALLDGISWPENMKNADIAIPVAQCTPKIKFGKKAKKLKKDGAQALFGALLGGLATSAAEEDPDAAQAPPVIYCRDEPRERIFGVYRQMNKDDGYLMTITDAGRAVRAAPAFDLDGNKDRYSVTLFDVAESRQFPDYNRLPSPGQLMDILNTERPVSITPTFGKDKGNIILGPDSL